MKHFKLLALLFFQMIFAQYDYPKTPEKAVVDDYFGTKITDNYRWLEDSNSPEVQKWFKDESDFSHRIINKIPNRDELFKQMKSM